MSNYTKLCSPLPPECSTDGVTICENTQQYLVNFLENFLPPSDCKSISDELRKTFILNKFRVKHKRRLDHKGKFSAARRKTRLDFDRIDRANRINYSDLSPLNRLWMSYMKELLGNESFADIPADPTHPNWENVNQRLIRADFHGAKISIDRSKCPTLVGLSGIVVRDTKNSFKICGEDSVIRTIPKDAVTIRIHLDDGVILKSFGKQLCVKPMERAVKKFKNTRMVQL